MGLSFNIGFFVVAVCLVVVAYYAYRRTTPPVSSRLRVMLTGLRTLAFVLLALLLMDPRYVLRARTEIPAEVVALIDHSASMSLPAYESANPTSPSRFDVARGVSQELENIVESSGGRYSELYFASDAVAAAGDSVRADGQGTDIRRSLDTAFKNHEGENVTAFVVLSDGIETEKWLVRRPVPPVPVFTVGIGDTTAPEDVRIKDVDYNSVVRSPSRSPIRATVEYTGEPPVARGDARRVKIRLSENGATVFEKDTLMTTSVREIVQDIPVDFPEPGRRRFKLDVIVDGFDAEPENNWRDIAIDAEKTGVRLLIIDQLPTWELTFLTELLRRDETFDFDMVSIAGDETPLERSKTIAESDVATKLGDYDAVVLMSVGAGLIDDAVARAITEFVRDRGKGLLVLPGPSSLFERPSAWNRLAPLLPVRGKPPYHFNLKYTSVRPGAQAMNNPITAQLVPRLSQTDWQQRSPLLGYYGSLIPKQGAETLLETADTRAPAFIFYRIGEGRVALVTTGPLWRWKFLSDTDNLYDELISRILDFLSRGDETERFVLNSRKNVYSSGEKAVLTAEVFNEKMQPVTGVPVKVEVSRVVGGDEIPLDLFPMRREGSDNPRFKVTLPPLGPGQYRVRGQADLPGRTLTSETLDISVSEASVEFQREHQDRSNLTAIALQSRGGVYSTAAGAREMARRIPLEVQTVRSATEVSLRTSVAVFAVILVLLSVEWIIRKRAGMI